MKKKLLFLVAFLFAGTWAVPALAVSTIEAKYTGMGPRRSAKFKLSGERSGAFYSGVYNFVLDPSSATGSEALSLAAATGPDWTFQAFCTDFLQNAPSSGVWKAYDVIEPADGPIGSSNSPMGAARADDLRRLLGTHQGSWLTGTSNQKKDKAAALQLALWEIVYEDSGTYDVKAGNFYTTNSGSWIDLADSYLTSLPVTVPDIDVYLLARDGSQDYSVAFQNLQPTNVPEPMTLVAVGSAIAGVGAYMRKRRLA